MGVLSTIDRAISAVQDDLIDGKIVYIELDKDNYELVQKEVENYKLAENISLEEKKVADIGKCLVLSYMDYKVIITVNNDKRKMEDFYFAFKTKII